MIHRTIHIAAALSSLALAASSASAAITFTFNNLGGATPQMVAGFNQAALLWSSRITDPITINININAAALPATVLGHTDAFYDSYAYTDVRNALVADAKSADDLSSTAHLQPAPIFSMLINSTANNPNGVVSKTPYFDTGLGGPGQAGSNNNSTIRLTTANAKAMGLSPGHSVLLDGTITFTNQSNVFDFDRSDGISASMIDFVGVAAHEIGHVLGFVSGVDVLDGNSAPPGETDAQLPYVTALDLMRFSSRSIGPGGGNGVIDWADDSFSKYFSVDGGTTPIAEFSTGSVNEASHWKDNLGLGLMDPTAGNGELLQFTSNDLRAFDAIGYDLAATLEPSSALLLAIPAAAALARTRRRNRSASQ